MRQKTEDPSVVRCSRAGSIAFEPHATDLLDQGSGSVSQRLRDVRDRTRSGLLGPFFDRSQLLLEISRALATTSTHGGRLSPGDPAWADLDAMHPEDIDWQDNPLHTDPPPITDLHRVRLIDLGEAPPVELDGWDD